MFETVLKTSAAQTRYERAPLARERDLFIQDFRSQGHSEYRAKTVNSLLLEVAIHIEWHDGAISLADLKTAAERWLASRSRHHE
ncbi:MAG: hypothetical protein ABI833_21530, partial [Acidobacteriota bacterium]